MPIRTTAYNSACTWQKPKHVVASIQYRVAPTARFPEPLEDVKASIRYLKAHADQFGIDPERIGIIGSSAPGGYLTAMAATTSGTTTFDKGDNLQVGSDVKAAIFMASDSPASATTTVNP